VENLENYFCHNEKCIHYNIPNNGNISVRWKYGKDNDRLLLYCRTCGKTFASTRDTPLFGSHLPHNVVSQIVKLSAEGAGVRSIGRILGISNKAVMETIARIGEHCATFLDNLLVSLNLTEVQLDELWTFVKKTL
jgi:transposase-like protein